MKKKTGDRKRLLKGDSQLELYAKKFYIDRFSAVPNGWHWESKIKWGLPPDQE